MKDVEIEKSNTDELIEIVGRESLDADKEAGAASLQEDEVTALTNAAKAEKAEADQELSEAVPAMERA